MIFVDIPAGESVFLDANTFVYHFAQHPSYGPPCTALLERIERQELTGITSTHVLSETAHRLMTIEACDRFGWPVAGIAARLRRRPDDVRQLMAYRQAIDAIVTSLIRLISITPDLVLAAADVSQQTGLLSNDALVVAVMRANQIRNLASQDVDFDRVSGVIRFASV